MKRIASLMVLAMLGTVMVGTSQVEAQQARQFKTGEVAVSGPVSFWHAEGRGAAGELISTEVAIIDDSRHGWVVLDQPVPPRVVPGSVLGVRGQLDRRSSTIQVTEIEKAEIESIAAVDSPHGSTDVQRGKLGVPTRCSDDHNDAIKVSEQRLRTKTIADVATNGSTDGCETSGVLGVAGGGGGSLSVRSTLVIPQFCVMPPPAGHDPAVFVATINDTVDPYFQDATYGSIGYDAETTPWLDLCATPGVQSDPFDAAVAAGFDPESYDRIVHVRSEPMLLSILGGILLGLANDIPGDQVVLFGIDNGTDPYVVAHELGHIEGLTHANRLVCVDATGAPVAMPPYSIDPPDVGAENCDNIEYGDGSDTMGNTVAGLPRFSAPQTVRAGWLEIPEAPSGATSTWTLSPAGSPDGVVGVHGVRASLASATYWFEWRQASGPDASISPEYLNGLQVRATDVPHAPFALGNSAIVDARPDEPGRVIPWGESWTSPEGAVISVGNPAPDTVDVTIDMPSGGLGPSAPQNVVASEPDPVTGMVTVDWDTPQNWFGVNSWYQVELITSDGGAHFASVSTPPAQIGPVGDGYNAVRVTPASTWWQTHWGAPARSNPVWGHAPMVGTPDAVEVTEYASSVSLRRDRQWAPPLVERLHARFDGTATTPEDYVPANMAPSAGLLFWLGWGLQSPAGSDEHRMDFDIVWDGGGNGETVETIEAVAYEQICSGNILIGFGPYWDFPGCLVEQDFGTVTLLDALLDPCNIGPLYC